MNWIETDNVLVTGALGWLGISLVEALARGLPDHDALREPRRELRIRCLAMAPDGRAVLVGGIGWLAQHGTAVRVERQGIPVVRFGEPGGVTSHDGGDNRGVIHTAIP